MFLLLIFISSCSINNVKFRIFFLLKLYECWVFLLVNKTKTSLWDNINSRNFKASRRHTGLLFSGLLEGHVVPSSVKDSSSSKDTYSKAGADRQCRASLSLSGR